MLLHAFCVVSARCKQKLRGLSNVENLFIVYEYCTANVAVIHILHYTYETNIIAQTFFKP